MNMRVFNSLKLVQIRVCVVNTGMVIFLGPTQCANVHSWSVDLKTKQSKSFEKFITDQKQGDF